MFAEAHIILEVFPGKLPLWHIVASYSTVQKKVKVKHVYTLPKAAVFFTSKKYWKSAKHLHF